MYLSFRTIAEKLQVHVTPQFQVINAGSSASFQCETSGHPISKIIWTVNGEIVTPNFIINNNTVKIKSVQRSDEGMYQCFCVSDLETIQGTAQLKLGIGEHPYMPLKSQSFANGTLVINEIEAGEDDGPYECAATNKHGHLSKSITWIRVEEKPVIGPLSIPERVDVGMHLTLVCTIIKGDEPVSVKWLKNGKILSPDIDVDFTEAKKYSLLQIRSARRKHDGNYTCLAENSAGNASKTVTLRVAVPPQWLEAPQDRIALYSADVSSLFGTELIHEIHLLYVYMTSLVDMRKKCENGYEHIKPGKKYINLANGTLIINNLAKTDRGRYRCEISNDVTPDLIKEVSLKVGSEFTILSL
ncbi:Down syndrome cell adhesion molecule-like protein Dscam2 [Nymphon striatum]|nr:Down syndrome cell adhesion molecule-like protein Dscam2 [Nymphon striatum]